MSNMDMQEPDVDARNSEDANKIYLYDKITGKDLLVSAGDYNECQDWKEAIKAHIIFAIQYPTLVLKAGDDSADDDTKRESLQRTLSESNGRPSSISLSKAWGKDEELSSSSPGASAFATGESGEISPGGSCVVPVPGFVIKTRRESGMKVFINVCEHEKVAQSDKKRGNKKWPLFVLGAAFRRSVDKNAEECNVLDVCVHTSVMTECVNDKSGEIREEVCVKIIDALRSREKDAAEGGEVPGGALDTTFSLPRLSKKYKGDEVVEMHLPSNMHTDKRQQNVFEAIDPDAPTFTPSMGSVAAAYASAADSSPRNGARSSAFGDSSNGGATAEQSAPNRKGSMFASLGRGGSKPSRFKSIVENVMPDRPATDVSTVPKVKRHIAFKVDRQVGAMVRQKPDKGSPRVKTLLQGTKVFVYGKRVMPDGSAWYRLLDGWTAAQTDMGQRTLSPVSDSQPVSAVVKGLRFQEVDGVGWFGSKGHRTVLLVEMIYPRDIIIRIQRSVEVIATLKSDVKSWLSDVADPGLKARIKDKLAEVPCPTDSISDGKKLVEDIDTLLDLQEGVEQWLSAVVQVIDAQECAPLRTFLTPSEEDIQSMERDLTAPQGLDGAWGNYD